MAKRFTDNEKWKDAWFMDLPSKYKLFWLYLLDECNHAGIWKVNFKVASFYIGEHLEYSEVKRILNSRITLLNDEYWYINKFIKYQYRFDIEGLNIKNNAHVSVLKILNEFKHFKPLTSPLLGAKDKDKDKDKDKERDKENKKQRTILLSEIKISELEDEEIEYFKIAKGFRNLFIKNLKEKNAPTKKQEKAKYKEYVTPIRLMMDKDGVTKEQLTVVFKFLDSPSGEFWKPVILSTSKLREKFSQLVIKSQTKNTNQNNKTTESDDNR